MGSDSVREGGCAREGGGALWGAAAHGREEAGEREGAGVSSCLPSHERINSRLETCPKNSALLNSSSMCCDCLLITFSVSVTTLMLSPFMKRATSS